MTGVARTEAQKRAAEIRAFNRELARLESEGVLALSDAQREALTTHHRDLLARWSREHDVDVDQRAHQLSLGMRIASFLGALALAASVFFLFRQFWGHFPTPVQVVLLIAAALGSLAATQWIHGRDATGYFTALAAMVAFACFVIDVSLLGMIFNITPSDNALLVWGAYALLLAYACDLRLLLAAGLLCLIGYMSARTGTWSGMYWLHFGERPENFFVAAALLFTVPLLIPHRSFTGFAPIYRVFGLLSLFLPMLVLANWGVVSYVDADPDLIEGAYQIAGFALSAAAVWLGANRQWNDVTNTGTTFFVIFLYTKFFDWWWEIMPKYLFFLVLALVSILLLLVMRRVRAAWMTQGAAR